MRLRLGVYGVEFRLQGLGPRGSGDRHGLGFRDPHYSDPQRQTPHFQKPIGLLGVSREEGNISYRELYEL